MSDVKDLVDAYRESTLLYVSQFEDWGVFIWKPLGWDAVVMYEKLAEAAPGAIPELEDQIFKDCVVNHSMPEEDFDEWQAGIVTTIAKQIMEVSSCDPADFVSRLDDVRGLVGGDILYQIYAFIMRVFPYKFEELAIMPIEILMERLALAEVITGEPMPIKVEKAPRPVHGAPIDFEAENKKFHDVDFAPPAGDFNLDRNPHLRGGTY